MRDRARLHFFHDQRSDVIVADYHLDGRNTGLELLTRLRQRLGYDAAGLPGADTRLSRYRARQGDSRLSARA